VITAVAAVRLDGLVAPFRIDAAMDGEIFRVYVEQVVVPTLRAGDVVVMDNLSAHKRPRVKELIEAAGATVLHLLPYSPDFNPIEMIWSKFKRLLRSIAARIA
jgi:transposase